MNDFSPRPKLAAEFANLILHQNCSRSGALIITAPRRTGLTTFLLRDLKPILLNESLAAYVDIGGGEADILAPLFHSEHDRRSGAQLVTTILPELGSSSQPRVVIIDAWGPTFSDHNGAALVREIESARHRFGYDLRLVIAGSDPEQFKPLDTGSEAIFSDLQNIKMPPLGIEFLKDVAARIAASPANVSVDLYALAAAFELVEYRPQLLYRCIETALNSLTGQEELFDAQLLAEARACRESRINSH
ncbi:hypothetical protein [Allohahella marinimesophila]|uniref:Uncharacterized protein n=1 Tax=Allohahella marinimesophila TaxID=1054972 RepID=A0ABP7Q6U3_9GAMM